MRDFWFFREHFFFFLVLGLTEVERIINKNVVFQKACSIFTLFFCCSFFLACIPTTPALLFCFLIFLDIYIYLRPFLADLFNFKSSWPCRFSCTRNLGVFFFLRKPLYYPSLISLGHDSFSFPFFFSVNDFENWEN